MAQSAPAVEQENLLATVRALGGWQVRPWLAVVAPLAHLQVVEGQTLDNRAPLALAAASSVVTYLAQRQTRTGI